MYYNYDNEGRGVSRASPNSHLLSGILILIKLNLRFVLTTNRSTKSVHYMPRNEFLNSYIPISYMKLLQHYLTKAHARLDIAKPIIRKKQICYITHFHLQ